jgi:hypothetical protein
MDPLVMVSIYERTDNDGEVWHRRINFAAGKNQLSLYLLLQLLHEEAGHVSMQVSLLSNKKLNRGQSLKGIAIRTYKQKFLTFGTSSTHQKSTQISY